MKKILYTKFQNIDDLISEMSKNKEISRAITRNNLYKFWNKVVGEKFSKNSKPYSMLKGSIMVIACKSSIVAQELMMQKLNILEKIQPYTKSLKIDVKDLKFDVKKWVDEK